MNTLKFIIRVRWKRTDLTPAMGMRAILKMLGRRFEARCLECSIDPENDLSETTDHERDNTTATDITQETPIGE